MDILIQKLNEIKKEVSKIDKRDPFNQMLERTASLVSNYLDSDNKAISRLKQLKVTTPYNSLDSGNQKSLQIEIDAILDDIEFVSSKTILEVQHKPSNTNKIELSTRRNIIDGFLITRMPWYGQIEQVNFLGRLFDLANLPSTDARYKTADQDIHKHTVLNNDWPDEWVFSDSRFNILHLNDNDFLQFLCLTIHPSVRDKDDQVITLLEIYNNNLSKHGIEILKSGEIAGRPLFEAKDIQTKKAPTAKGAQNDKQKLALVIGSSKYTYGGNLSNPINDANAMESKLKGLGFSVIKIIDPTQKELKICIDDFGDKLRNFDVGLFYFAGHGIQVKGLNYLIPVDANLKSEKMVEYDCVEAERVLRHMEDSKAEVNLLILDACRDNPFERSWGRGIGQRGLATMNAPKGSLIAYSTSPGNTADDGDGENGLYTEILLNHIDTKQTTVTTMFQLVRIGVISKSDSAQVPWESTSLTADFYFNP